METETIIYSRCFLRFVPQFPKECFEVAVVRPVLISRMWLYRRPV